MAKARGLCSSWRWLAGIVGLLAFFAWTAFVLLPAVHRRGAQAGLADGSANQANQASRTICTNTCFKARDGVCDDGQDLLAAREGNVAKRGRLLPNGTEVYCDLGTDCDDCGLWETGPGVSSWTSKEGPIALLRRLGVPLYVRLSTTPLPFLFPFTDPSKDIDVSGWMYHRGVVESGITKVFYKVLNSGVCNPEMGSPGLVLDVGANFGYFSVVSALQGCRVIAWEPVPHFRAFLEYALQLNQLQHLVEVRPYVVTNVAGIKVNMTVPQRGIWGTAGINGLNIDPNIDNQGKYQYLQVKTERLDGVAKEDVALLKVDVEGFEPEAVQSVEGLFNKGFVVNNVLLEYSPGIPERHRDYASGERMPQLLLWLLRNGFSIGFLPDHITRPMEAEWKKPLPSLLEITRLNAVYDLRDQKLLQVQKLAHPFPAEIMSHQVLSRKYTSNHHPVWFHPLGFRCMFGYNTNIWASRDRTLLGLRDTVGVLAPSDHPLGWTSTRFKGYGQVMVRCSDLRADQKVPWRCPCNGDKSCDAEEKLVQRLATKGKMPFAVLDEGAIMELAKPPVVLPRAAIARTSTVKV